MDSARKYLKDSNWPIWLLVALWCVLALLVLHYDKSPATKVYPCIDKDGFACDGGESSSTY